MIDISKLQSAVVITDPDEIEQVLSSRTHQRKGLYSTDVTRSDNGDIVVTKHTPLTPKIIGTGAPKTPTGEALQKLFEERGLEYRAGDEQRVVPYWASDESVDSYGDIVRQDWDFGVFAKNPLMPYSHDWFSPPIGKHLSWEVTERRSDAYIGPALWILSYFAPEDISERADSIFRLVKANIITSGSVGFRSGSVINVTDEEERAKLGLGKYGYILDKNTLLEFSVVPMGANDGAHALTEKSIRANNLRAFDVVTLRELNRKSYVHRAAMEEQYLADEMNILDAARSAFPALKDKFVPHTAMNTPLYADDAVVDILRAEVPDEDLSQITELSNAIEAAVQQFCDNVSSAVSSIVALLPSADTEGGGDDDSVDDEDEEENEESRSSPAIERLTKAVDTLERQMEDSRSNANE